jgi:hypothetical protein
MPLFIYTMYAFIFSVIFIIAINLIRDAIRNSKISKYEKSLPKKYVGATENEVEKMLDILYEESCFYPFDSFENAD